MKKLTLDLETIAVESFDTRGARVEPRGTVRGLDESATVVGYECVSLYTHCDCTEAWDCPRTDEFSCFLSCQGTCEGETC